MSFTLSNKSISRLNGVDPRLSLIVRDAINYTSVDFGISEGMRTFERQKQLFEEKKTKTLNSKHLIGKAIDVFAWVDSNVSWNNEHYDMIAEAVRKSAKIHGGRIRWGAAWTCDDIRTWNGSMKALRIHYINERKLQGKSAFIDCPHFEIN
jgi:hypothetical protein